MEIKETEIPIEDLKSAIECCKSIEVVEELLKQKESKILFNKSTLGAARIEYSRYKKYLISRINANSTIEGVPLIEIINEYFKLTKDYHLELDIEAKKKIVNNKSNLRKILNVNGYIQSSIDLLDSNILYERIVGLLALTGRRACEISSTANLEGIESNEYEVIFSGQKKLKSRENTPYRIPLLHNSSAIIQSLNELRYLKPEWVNSSEKGIDSKALNYKVREHLSSFIEGHLKASDLRSIYTIIAFTIFARNPDNITIDRDVFYSRILGHDEENPYAYENYVKFCIPNKSFKLGGDR